MMIMESSQVHVAEDTARTSSSGSGNGNDTEICEEGQSSVIEEEDKLPPSGVIPVPLIPLNPHEIPCMELTKTEREWALTIRDAIEGLPDLDDLSDFMVAHLAIAGKGNLQWAVERAYKLQQMKQQYDILGTLQEGVVAIKKFIDLYPGSLLSFSYDVHSGKVEVVLDATILPKEAWKRPENVAVTLKAAYYMCHASFPSFEAVRVGNIHMIDFDGYDWKRGMLDAKMFGMLGEESHGSFPSHIRQTRFYNTKMMANLMVSMGRRLVPKEVADTWKVGCSFAGGQRLDQFFMLPTPKAATQRLYASFCKALQLRYECEMRFSLGDDD